MIALLNKLETETKEKSIMGQKLNKIIKKKYLHVGEMKITI